MDKVTEWQEIETLIAGLSEIARAVKEMEDSHTSDERCKVAADLNDAKENNDPVKAEQVVESNPVESADVLPNNTTLNTEAEQAIDGGVDKEVKNEAAIDFVEDIPWDEDVPTKKHSGILGAIQDNEILNNPYDYEYEPTSEEKAALNKANREDYYREKKADRMYGEHRNDNPLPAVIENEDLPVNLPPAVIEPNLPSEEIAPSYTIEGEGIEPITQGGYEISTIPTDEPEDEKELDPEMHDKGFEISLGANHTVDPIGGSSNAGSISETPADNYNGSMSFGSGKGIIGGSNDLANLMVNPKYDKPKQDVMSEASKAPLPTETISKSSPIGVKSNPTTSNRTSNGGFNSGGVNKTGNSLIKVKTSKLPDNTEHTQDYSETLDTEDLSEATIANLEMRIRNLDRNTADHLGFEIGDKVSYNGSPLDKLDGGTINNIEEILDSIGA